VLGFAAQGRTRPIIAKGNAGIPKYHEGHIHYDGTPELMAEYAVLARDAARRSSAAAAARRPSTCAHMREALETPPAGPAPDARPDREALGGFSSASDGTDDGGPGAPRARRRARG
jgi:5-methyltetrahydrofolate--homocysteine methyltransferase